MRVIPFDAVSSPVVPAGWFLGARTTARLAGCGRKGWWALQGAGAMLGPTGPLTPNSSTICFQEIERGTSLTFGVVLPVAIRQSSVVRSPGSELCLQSISVPPAPAVSQRSSTR